MTVPLHCQDQLHHSRPGASPSNSPPPTATGASPDNHDHHVPPPKDPHGLLPRILFHRPTQQQRQPQPPPPPPPPPPPRPWAWRCHNCAALLPLACTRRCLHCGHRLCTRPAPGLERGRSRGRVLGRSRTCRTEFDYLRWRAWGAWREGASDARRGGGGCWRDCDYPSECRHARASVDVDDDDEEEEKRAAGLAGQPAIIRQRSE
ncbi:hypothetical protein CH35J_007693 [Colletotrichum higginsianum]|uniref:Uncharacterized protein n=1 Tax=Colletotrichum higginsianum TaxID=80884 RepID=A0A4V4NBX0_9PEZI|nr:hypothetical protein CH35J_007693 [Colletotrichum higginsianum]